MSTTGRRWFGLLGLFGLFGLLSLPPLTAQGPVGDPTAPPVGLRFVVLDVDQGSANILIGPTGIAMVVDAGGNGRGNSRVIPTLRSLGVTRVTHALASHYHADHVGGMDELIHGFPVGTVWDRGPTNVPSTASYRSYASAAGQKRRTVTPGAVFDLGGGATARVLAVDGKVLGGASYPVHTGAQVENARSIVMRIEYGNFSMWLGGDCTGGGNSTYDIESKVARVCGDVDVYVANHHGSNTSTNATTVGLLAPEVCFVSAGYQNSYGHPTTRVINRLNQASASRMFIGTTSGSRSWRGFSRGGTTTLTTDGYRYRLVDVLGQAYDVYTDEVPSPAITAGSLKISELHNRPATSDGSYLEIYCQGPGPVNLRGLQVRSNAGAFTIATPYRLLPGDYFLVSQQGDRSRNGGLPLTHCWPYRALTFDSQSDAIRLLWRGQVVDQLVFNRNLAGGNGVAAERTVLDASTSVAVFSAARGSYGAGDRGSPGSTNSTDLTAYEPIATMEVLPASTAGGAALHMIATAQDHRNQLHAMAMSLGTRPGMNIAGTLIPLNPDSLFNASLLLPGVRGTIPARGRRGLRLIVPRINGLQGLRAYYAQVILDPTGPRPFPAASNAAPFVFP